MIFSNHISIFTREKRYSNMCNNNKRIKNYSRILLTRNLRNLDIRLIGSDFLHPLHLTTLIKTAEFDVPPEGTS